ncbi:Protein TonB [Tenacibaculum sp. 190130A14a]|uniref:Periplasmic protein TonB n=1 Tax=Tenacibaculum polynesiense TaxID=3137857 RepID=A0ABM9PEL0_9FLAO
MKMPKKYPKKQLEKFSAIFMQLGLVLVLFVVYLALEHETSVSQSTVAMNEGTELPKTFNFDQQPIILVKKVEKQKLEPAKKKKPIKDLSNVIKADDDDVVETIIDTSKDDTTAVIDVDSFKEAYEEDIDTKDDPNPVSIRNVQNVPVFRGCEGLSEKETRICFENKIQKHVKRYFNSDIAQDAGLRSGKYKIYTQFVIDKNGNITDVKIKAPHKRLQKEVNRVITKIPQFEPGKQNNEPVKVRYTLPIAFKVE